MSVTIYAAGPIDLAPEMPDWRKDLIEMLDSCGVVGVMFDPASAFKSSKWGVEDSLRSTFIEELNAHALVYAKIFIACVPKSVHSIGVPIEIDLARKQIGKQRYVLTDIKRGKSVYLDNRFNSAEWVYVDDLTDVGCIRMGLLELSSCIAKRDLGPQPNG